VFFQPVIVWLTIEDVLFIVDRGEHDPKLLEELGIINNALYESGKSKNQEIMLSIIYNGTYSISKNIDWNSAPEMKVNNMTIIPIASLNSSVKRIVDVYPASRNLQINLFRQPLIVEREKGEDPSVVIIDEIVGMGISLVFLPKDWRLFVIAFILFRIFDIWKPLFIDNIQNVKGGLGIMLDDLLAGLYTLFAVHIIRILFF